ncbi:MAG: hypothetical protein AABX14_02090 [Candidatus Aenigmatarchaeota archaeon]
MNDFEFYLEEGDVKKRKQDTELAKSLLKDAKDRLEKVSQLKINEFTKIIFENIYDALRAIMDAILAADGYKSYSHEASIAYLKKYGFDQAVIAELDNFRALRNASKYYGKQISLDNANSIKNFYGKYAEKIIRIAEESIGRAEK